MTNISDDTASACPKVTVVTVCRNVRDMLARTIDSVSSQTYPNIEYVVVDGMSTDGTPEMLYGCAAGIDKWISEPDRGIYDAMNKGVGLASGEWVIFMNAGDTFYAPDTVERVFSTHFDRDVDVVYGDVAIPAVCGFPRIKTAAEPRNCHRMFFCHQSAFARREALLSHPFDIERRYSADFKFFKTLLLGGSRFVHVGLPVALYDMTGVSNRRRSEGLRDNIRVVSETDNAVDRLRFLPRLWFNWAMCRLRGK